MRAYTNGRAPLPSMGPNLELEWARFQRLAVVNTGGLIVDALAERIVPTGVTVDGDTDPVLRLLWRDNRLDATLVDVIRDVLTVGVGYLLVQRDEKGRAVILRERPEQCVTIPDPVRPWRTKAGLKMFHDEFANMDHAYVYTPAGTVEHYARQGSNLGISLDRFQLVERSRVKHGCPLIRVDNLEGLGEFEAHTDLIDRINWGILQRLVTTAMQAFRQRALVADADTAPLPEFDENGDSVDFRSLFKPGPGHLWELPPGVRLWESQPADLSPMLSAVKDDFRQLAAVTRTPITMLIPESANQLAEGVAAAREGLVFKARDRINRFTPCINAALVRALEIMGKKPAGTVSVVFEPPALVTMGERYDAAIKAKAAGESLESIQRNILGYSPEQIHADRVLRARAMFTLPATPPPAERAPVDSDGAGVTAAEPAPNTNTGVNRGG